MPKFLAEILENGKSVPNSSNDTIDDIIYVSKEEFSALDKAGKLKENTVYAIDEEDSSDTSHPLGKVINIEVHALAYVESVCNIDYSGIEGEIISSSLIGVTGSENDASIAKCVPVSDNKSILTSVRLISSVSQKLFVSVLVIYKNINIETLQGIAGKIYPVGSVYMTNDKTNPSEFLGGEWELIDKQFKEVSEYSDTEFMDINPDICDNAHIEVSRADHTLFIGGYFTNKVQIDDSTAVIGTLKFDKLGITRLNHNPRFMGWCDLKRSGLMMDIQYQTGELRSFDVLGTNPMPAVSISDGYTCFSVTMPVGRNYILDEFCDKFFWKCTKASDADIVIGGTTGGSGNTAARGGTDVIIKRW